MKTILTLTDFSLAAENAAKYALALAADEKADVILCNAFSVPAEAPMAARIAWPLMDYDVLVNESNTELDILVKNLQRLPEVENDYVPNIEFESCVGTVQEVTLKLVRKKKIDLVVMGMAGSGAVSQMLLGSNCRSMIEDAIFPVMYIPFEANYIPLKTIAFATDLRLEDVKVIKSILNLLQPLAPRLRIINITDKEVLPASKRQVMIDTFLQEVCKQIQQVNIVYEYVWNIDIDNGLDWITEQPEIDLIAIVHHQHSLISRLIKGSHTQKLARKTKIPLLVYPHPNLGIK